MKIKIQIDPLAPSEDSAHQYDFPCEFGETIPAVGDTLVFERRRLGSDGHVKTIRSLVEVNERCFFIKPDGLDTYKDITCTLYTKHRKDLSNI